MVEVDPRERLSSLPEGLPEFTLGYEALAWAAKYLRHPNGIRAGMAWQFTREQARFVLWYYSVDENGRWLFHHAARRLAKGSGKSPFAAVMAMVELLAPVRFDHFDESVPGGCVGRPVSMPWVQIAAVSLDQTENTMRMVRAMASPANAPKLHEDYQLDVGKTQIFVQPEGKLEVITSSAATAEGAEATFVVGDELEHWTPSNGGVELHSTLLDNLSKSGSRMLETLNAWKPGISSAGEATFDDWVLQETGRSKNESKILYDARQAPHDTDMSDAESLRAGLEWVYGDCPWADVDAIMTRIWSPSARVDDSKRKYLNWPVASSDSWADPQDWAQMARPDITVDPGEDIVMFFDGSLSNDHTALVGCRVEDGHVFTIGVWKPRAAHPDDKPMVDVQAVDDRVDFAFATWNVLAFFADVREWESFTKVAWPERYRDRLELWATSRGAQQPEPIAWDMRGKDFAFTTAAELCEAEIMQHSFTHDGNPLLTEHALNMRRYEGRYGITVRKESRKSAKKIDAGVCMIGARMVWRLVREQNGRSKKKQRTGKAFFI
ncbi:terminase [Corynebacterium striatum]